MAITEKMPLQQTEALKVPEAQYTPYTDAPSNDGRNYRTFDPLLPRARDVEAACTQCTSFNNRRRLTEKQRGWCASCCSLLFKLASLVALWVVLTRVFHIGQGKHWRFLDLDEDPSGWPLTRSKGDVRKVSCPEEQTCAKSFSFAKVDSFELRNLIGPVKNCGHNTSPEYNFIEILEANASQGPDIVVDFSFNVSNPATQRLLEIEQGDSSLLFRLPTSDPRVEPVCDGEFSSWTKLYVRKGLHLNAFGVESRIQRINIPSALDLTVDQAYVKIQAATLNAAPFINAQFATVETAAGSISGTFLLHESVTLSAEAGQIDVDIIPQESDKKSPATLDLRTSSGHINARLPPPNTIIPDREYHVSAVSIMGSVSGRYILNKETYLSATLGKVDAVLIPFASSGVDKLTLSTVTEDGVQRIKVLQPYTTQGARADTALKNLDGYHTSNRGSISIIYPPEWEGGIEAETTMGPATMTGEGLMVTKERSGIAGTLLKGIKGSGQGFTRVRNSLGSIRFAIDYVDESL